MGMILAVRKEWSEETDTGYGTGFQYIAELRWFKSEADFKEFVENRHNYGDWKIVGTH